jgi:hypothetical protein
MGRNWWLYAVRSLMVLRSQKFEVKSFHVPTGLERITSWAQNNLKDITTRQNVVILKINLSPNWESLGQRCTSIPTYLLSNKNIALVSCYCFIASNAVERSIKTKERRGEDGFEKFAYSGRHYFTSFLLWWHDRILLATVGISRGACAC